MCRPWFPTYETSATVFFIISRETVTFHCQLSGGLKLGSIEFIPPPVAALVASTVALALSRVRQVGQSAKLTWPEFHPVSNDVVQGGLSPSLRSPAITFERLKYRPAPMRSAVLPSPLMSQARPTRGWKPHL